MNKFNVGDKVVLTKSAKDQYALEIKENPTGWVKGFVDMVNNSSTKSVTGIEGDRIYCGGFFVYEKDLQLVSEKANTASTPKKEQTEWTDKHYDAIYKLTEKDIERGWIKIDPYRVSKQWHLGSKDESGALFHVLKTLARIGEKNSVEREVKALLAQIKCFAEIEGIYCE